jgi:NADH-quinone oxidoreductase subunit N
MNAILSVSDLMLIAPELYYSLGAMVLLLVGAFASRLSPVAMVWGSLLLLLSGAVWLIDSSQNFGSAFQGMFLVTPFISVMKLLIIFASSAILWLMLPLARGRMLSHWEAPLLIVLATVGLLFMVSANNLMALYLGLEMGSLALYVLAAMGSDVGGQSRNAEAALKYFVLGALASGLILFGASLIYGFTGSTSFEQIAAVITEPGQQMSAGFVIGMVFLLTGLIFKTSAAPFHMWTPDVYEGAAGHITAFFAAAPKVAAITILARVSTEAFSHVHEAWRDIFLLVAIASMAVGAFAALRQQNIKRLLAYSSIGHVGYMLAALLVMTDEGLSATVTYLIIYVIMTAGAFACVLMMRKKDAYVEDITDLSGLSQTRPKLALCMAVLMFSMAGIPPLAGFFAKMYLFLAVIAAGYWWLAVVGVLASVVSAYYYLRIVKIMYFNDTKQQLDEPATEHRWMLGGAAVFCLVYFLYPTPLLVLGEYAGKGLGMF